MPQWWDNLMVWMDTSFIPVWIVVLAFLTYLLLKFWWEMRAFRRPLPPRSRRGT